MSCVHRTTGRWGRVWDTWLVASVGSFAVVEGVALATTGPPGTLSAYLRRAAGLSPACKHSRFGRGLIFAACAWCAIHLGYGVLGIGGRV